MAEYKIQIWVTVPDIDEQEMFGRMYDADKSGHLREFVSSAVDRKVEVIDWWVQRETTEEE